MQDGNKTHVLTKPQEAQYIRAAKKGDRDAFGSLYDAYIRDVYRFVYYKTHHRATAEDLTSEIFMKALKAMKRYDGSKSSFRTWLLTIARRRVIDHYRSQKQESTIDDAWDLHDGGDIERDADIQLRTESVLSAMQHLTDVQRDILMLRIWEGYSYREISEIIGKTEAACKMQYVRGIKTLKTELLPFLILSFLFI